MLVTPHAVVSDNSVISNSYQRAGTPKAVKRAVLYFGLMILDLAALLGGWGAVALAYGDAAAILQPLTAVIGVYACFATISDCWSLRALEKAFDSIRMAANALLLAIIVVVLVAWLVGGAANVLRPQFALTLGVGAGLLFLVRAIYPRYAQRVLSRRLTNKLVIVDGTSSGRWHNADVVIDAGQHSLVPDLDDPVMLDRFGHIALAFDKIVIDCLPERRREWATLLKGMHVDGEIVVPGMEDLGAVGIAKALDGRSSVVVSRRPLSLTARMVKRVLDLVLTVPALILLSPLLIATAIAIKLDSPGPVLFRQDRIGRGNRLFKVLKFRSMRVDGSDPRGTRSTARNDSRVTRVGKFIRATSIDELPQLLNVLVGDMSLVGPRPHPIGSLAEGQLFWHIDIRYWHRHQIKPGITGLAQVRGFRGATHQVSDLTNRLQADLEYIDNWSIWRDIKILAQTLRVVVHDNAF